ncbi:hypothetical protein CLF_113233, partial [Clonorchis sinensis]
TLTISALDRGGGVCSRGINSVDFGCYMEMDAYSIMVPKSFCMSSSSKLNTLGVLIDQNAIYTTKFSFSKCPVKIDTDNTPGASTVRQLEEFQLLKTKATEVKGVQGQHCKERQILRFEMSLSKTQTSSGPVTYHDARTSYCGVVNLSNRPLSEEERCLLEKGLNFAVSKRVIRAEEIIPSVESVFQKLPPMEAEKLRVQLVTVLKSQQPGAPNITPAERRALNGLKKVDNIVITKADKGKATVVMDKSDYLQKVKRHLAEGPYRQIDNANITSIMNRRKAEVGKYLRSVINHLGQEEVDRTAAQIEVINKLRGSGYPASLIRRQLRRVLVPVEKPKREWLGTAVIPYKPGTSETIRRILNTANIRVGFQRGNTLRSALVQLKDRLPANRTRDCVYKIKCSDCIKVYIGQTARELHTRIVEHKRKINKPPRNADEYRALLKDSAIAEHALDTGHKIDLENVEVLRRGLRSTSQRLMAEAVEIAKHPSVNRIEGVELARVWRTVLDQSS